MKKRTFIIITVVLVLAAIAAILWQTGVFAKVSNKITDNGASGGSSGSTSSSGTSARNDNFPLKKGSYGENVKTLQTALNKFIKNYTKLGKEKFKYNGTVVTALVVDGDFGVRTNAAMLWALGYDNVDGQGSLNNLVSMANGL